MAQYPIPSDTAPTFDPNAFAPPIVGITRAEADILYCHYPNIQGDITAPQITAFAVATDNVFCQQTVETHTLKYTLLDPPIPPGSAGTLDAVLTQGNNAGGLDMTNVGGIEAVSVEASLYTVQLEIIPTTGAGIVITAPSSTNLNIPSDITASGKQINARAFVADYECAVYPDSQTETSNLILGANNNNNYNLFQYNPVGGATNQLTLQYQKNSILPSTTTTLMVIDGVGDINLGLLNSPDPFVNIQGSTGLGRIYDSLYNRPKNPGTGSIYALNLTPENNFLANYPNTVFTIDTTTLNPDQPLNRSNNVDLIMSNFSVPVVITGTAGVASTLIFYLGYTPAQAYDATKMTSVSFTLPAQETTPYTVNINYYYNSATLSLVSTVAFSKLYLLAELIPSTPAPNLIATMGALTFSGIAKSYTSGSPITITPNTN